jgi:hypothetical protein
MEWFFVNCTEENGEKKRRNPKNIKRSSVMSKYPFGLAFAVVALSCCNAEAQCEELSRYEIGGFEIHEKTKGRFEVVVGKQNAGFRPLRMAPEKMEPELKRGIWLVAVCGRRSPFEVANIRDGMKCAGHLNGKVQFGVRLFSQVEENRAWLPPEIAETRASMLWLVIHNGEVIRCGFGYHREAELRTLIESALKVIRNRVPSA